MICILRVITSSFHLELCFLMSSHDHGKTLHEDITEDFALHISDFALNFALQKAKSTVVRLFSPVVLKLNISFNNYMYSTYLYMNLLHALLYMAVHAHF